VRVDEVHDQTRRRTRPAYHRRGVDAVLTCLVEQPHPLAVVAHHPEQRHRHPELREPDRLVRALAAEHLPPLPRGDRRLRARHVVDAEDEIAGHLPGHEHVIIGHGRRLPLAGAANRFRVHLRVVSDGGAPPRRDGGAMTTTLTRPRHRRVIAGVCAGIAERFGWPVRRVRLVFLLSCLLPGPQVLAYLGLWLFMPQRGY
jgi:phage shock protein C